MPKRKRSRGDDSETEYLIRKLRKLERKINSRRCCESSDSSDKSPTRYYDLPPENEEQAALTLESQDWLEEPHAEPDAEGTGEIQKPATEISSATVAAAGPSTQELTSIQEGPSTSTGEQQEPDIELDTEVLQILGEDPSAAVKYGKDIRKEVASRFQHVATEGLSKESRKELIAKYLTPANCMHIDAPKLNPEMKAAIPENISKRDKGIEVKQKQMACAISCLGEVITLLLNSKSKEKNNEWLQKLIDAGRLLCDIQHGDSVTRRNFILFSLKKEMKEHLTNTKIDSMLFSENLPETLKSAKAVNKSGFDLKGDNNNKTVSKKPKQAPAKFLNRKAPPPARRPPGTAHQRSREPAAPRAPPPAAHLSRTSSSHHPPPPPPPAPRRRY